MAEYRNKSAASSITTTYTQPTAADQAPSPTSTTIEATTIKNSASERQPDKLSVAAGKLMEVDLGSSLSKHEEEAAAKAAKPVKVRLGRDGKPWRPRKRRNSDDLARDALIDSIMKENSRMYPPHPFLLRRALSLTAVRDSITIPRRRATICGNFWQRGLWSTRWQ